MEHCLYEFYFVYWVQKFVHVDWVGGVDFFDWVDRLIWECAGDRLISECAEYHVGTFVVGCDGTWEAVGLSFVSHRGRGGRGGNTPQRHCMAPQVLCNLRAVACNIVWQALGDSTRRLPWHPAWNDVGGVFPTSSGRPYMATHGSLVCDVYLI